MPSICRVFRDRVLAHGGEPPAFEPDLAQHVISCASCASFARRVSDHAHALRGLVRRAAPGELDGVVVAACNAGHRQARAISALHALSRWEVPAELDTKVLEGERSRDVWGESPKAPRVLDRLVDEDLHDPPKALARRFTGRLERLRAPGVLRARVEHGALASSSAPESEPAGGRNTLRELAGRRTLRVLVLVGLSAAAAVLVVSGIYWSRAPRYSFDVVHESSLEKFDPVVSSLLGAVTGGVSDAHPLQGEPR
jgi:hypothetical protein